MTYDHCIKRIKDSDLRNRLESIRGAVVKESADYKRLGLAGNLHQVVAATNVGSVSGVELSDVYRLRFAKSSSPGRIVYDRLIAGAANDRCPLCGHRQVTTLDHFLPSSKFPALSVTPLNLVPACSDCNKMKLDRVPGTPGEVTLHPYFDNVDDDTWLWARVRLRQPASLAFSVVAPVAWSAVMETRVKHHFDVFQLGSLYAKQAAEELSLIQHNLESVLNSDGPVGVSSFLEESAVSRRNAHMNSWQTATYDALYKCDWFCAGGFR